MRISVRGVVQGVGFRPFVYSLAARCGVRGWVRNTSAGVEVLAEGAPAAVAAFAEALPAEAPPRSHIAAYEVREVPPGAAVDGPAPGEAFVILESAADPAAYQLVSPDIATCADCRRELLDPDDRRHDYPFTNCTNCGPRFTIIEDLPYDRERTTMRRSRSVPPAGGSTRTRPTGASTPSPTRVPSAGRACGCCGSETETTWWRWPPAAKPTRRRPSARPPSCCAAARSSPSRASAASTSPATPRTARPCAASSGANGVPTSRSPSCSPAWTSCACTAWSRPEEEALLTSPEHPIVLLEWRDTGPAGEPGEELGGGGGDPIDHGGRRPPALSRRHAAVHAAARAAARRRPAGRSS